EPLGKTRIEIYKSRRGEVIAPSTMIDGVESSIAVRVFGDRGSAADMKTTLRPEYAAGLNLPGKFHQPVDLEDMIQRQIGWAFIEVGAIEKSSSLSDKLSAGCSERSILV